MSQSNENPFLKGPRIQGGNPFLNGPRIQRQSPLATLGSPEYRARAQNLTRSRNADELMATSSREPVDRTIGEVINDTALALRQGARNVTAGVVGLPVDAANFAIDPLGARLGRMAAEKIGDALGVSLPERAKTIKGLLTGSDYFEQPAAVRGIREGISETNRADREEWASDWLRQREQQFEKVDGFGGTLSYLARNPGYTGHVLAEQLPQVALNVVPGSKLGTLLAQGASAGGQASAEVSESLRKKGVSEQEIAAASSGAFAGSAVINTVVGSLMGRYGGMAFERAIGREIAEDAAAAVAGRMGVFGRAVGGETATNIIEEGGDQANQNFWSRDPLLDGVGKAAAIGGLMGAGMGAAAGATGAIGASINPTKPGGGLRSELLTLGEELAGRDVVREETRHVPSMPQRVQKDPGIVPEDASDIDALLMRNLPQRGRAKLVANPMPQGLGEQLAAGTVFDSAPPVLDATRIGDALAGVDFAQQAPKLDAVLLGEMLAGDVLSRQPESSPETPVAAGNLLSAEAKTEAPQGAQAEVPVKHSEMGQSDAKPVGGRPSLLLRAKEIIRNALRLSKADKRYTESHELMGVSESEVAEARENGLDILGYKHAVDGSAIRHVFKNHGNAKKEAARGQIAITDADFERIPEILESPDKRIYGLKNDIGREMVGYLKTMPDGTTFYLEEVRTGRRTLTAQSMRKYPRTTSAASIEKTLRPTSETLPGDGGSVAQSGAKETLWKRSVRPAPTDVASGPSPEALTEPLPHAVTGSAANIGRTGGDVRADSAPPAEPVAEPQKNSTTVMQHRDHPHAVSVGSRPAQVDIEDAVKAQSEPNWSNRNGSSNRDETGIPAGLPAVSTAASERLARALHAHLRRRGYSGKPPRFLEILPSSLPHELYEGLQALGRVTGTRVVIFRNLTPEIDDFNGVNFRDGTVYINENNEYPATLTAAHEWVHNFKETHPELYQQLENEVRRQGRIGAWYERNIREEGMDRGRDHAIEELTAAAVSDALTDPEFLQRLAERNRGLFRRVAEAFLDFLSTLTRGWRDQGSNQYLQDVEAFRDKLAAILDALPENGSTGSSEVDALFQRVWHGTPHRGIEKTGFKLNAIGTGEGAQAYGWGIYFASQRAVAEHYRKGLSYREQVRQFMRELPGDADIDEVMEALGRGDLPQAAADVVRALAADDWLGFDYPAQAITAAFKELDNFDPSPDLREAIRRYSGQLYQVEIPEDSDLLDWDKPLSEQPPRVREAIEAVGRSLPEEMRWMWHGVNADTSGKALYGLLGEVAAELDPDGVENIQQAASELLREHGIPGLRYLDGDSRAAGEGSHNYVIWDESLLTPEAAQIEAMFSRKAQTKAAYEARIDALFAGDRPSYKSLFKIF